MKIVYIVDDDGIFRKVISKYIRKRSHTVMEFDNGRQVIKRIKEDIKKNTLPNCILLDVRMPVLDGWETLDELLDISKKNNIKFNITIMTSSISKNDMTVYSEKYRKYAKYYLKPLTKDEITEVLK